VGTGGSHFHRAFDMLLTVHLSEIIIDLAWDEIRLAGDRVERRFSS
jgi:hypothetical protein